MIRRFTYLIRTKTGKDSGVMLFGTLINAIIGGLFFILAARMLGPLKYGLFSVVMATGLMAVNFANFGIDSGILRFIKLDNEKENQRILKIAFKAYLLIGFSIFIVGILFSQPLAFAIGVPQIANLLKISFAGIFFILLTNFFVAELQSRGKFIESSIITLCSNIARLLILALASYFLTVDLYFLTIIFFFITIVSVVLGKIFVPLDFLKATDEQIHLKDFFGYNFWLAASLAISAIPYDTYLITKLSGPLATGMYSAPMKILTVTYQFAGSLSRVFAVRFSSFDTRKKVINFSLKASLLVAILSFAILLIGFLAAPIIKIFFGSEYYDSILIFRILSVGMAFFFADTIPMAITLYYFGKSKMAFFITVWHYALYVLLLFILIPITSAMGAAIAFTISEAVTFLTLAVYIIYKLREKHGN